MKALPIDVKPYKRTPIFNELTVPQGLIKAHRTKAGTWAQINILEGELLYRIFEPVAETHVLAMEFPGIIEPEAEHAVEPKGPVSFFVEFYRQVKA